MCGIMGFFDGTESSEQRKNKAHELLGKIAHRGPDAEGVWSGSNGLTLGHRRLIIIGSESTGQQPMVSLSKEWVIVFNGAIYNYVELARKLEIPNFEQGITSDTEVLLFAIDQWGVEKTLVEIEGMYAFGVWNTKNHCLYLARDFFGEKPLYYSYSSTGLCFASEVPALASQKEHRKIDREGLRSYFSYGFVPAPNSLFEGVHKLRPGHYIVVNKEGLKQKTLLKQVDYRASRFDASLKIDESEKEHMLKEILRDSVKARLRADTSLGIFLSGGIDSSIVTALAVEEVGKVSSFSIGNDSPEINEAPFAKKTAEIFGTNHHEFHITGEDARKNLDKVVRLFDEPNSDVGQMPFYFLAQQARKHVKVCLGGDGADELFGGYVRYIQLLKLTKKTNKIPAWIGSALEGVSQIQPAMQSKLLSLLGGGGLSITHERVSKVSKILRSQSVFTGYDKLVRRDSGFYHPQESVGIGERSFDFRKGTDLGEIQTHDLLFYLPSHLLFKSDRLSMVHALEYRAPFLSSKVFGIANQLDDSDLVSGSSRKVILKNILKDYLPKDLIERPKLGFSAPVNQWMQAELKEKCQDYFSESYIKRQGIFNSQGINTRYHQFKVGNGDYTYPLWDLLVFQIWLDGQNISA